MELQEALGGRQIGEHAVDGRGPGCVANVPTAERTVGRYLELHLLVGRVVRGRVEVRLEHRAWETGDDLLPFTRFDLSVDADLDDRPDLDVPDALVRLLDNGFVAPGYGKLTVNFPNDYGISGVIKPDSSLKKRKTVLFVIACFKPDIINYAVIHVRRRVENADVGKWGYGMLLRC